MSPEDIKEIKQKIKTISLRYHNILISLIELIEENLETLKPKLPKGEIRYVAEVDYKNDPDTQIKSIKSIVEKIERSNGKYTPDNFSSTMTDILRDRIICNYLSDITAIVDVIRGSAKINEQFEIIDEKDTIYESRTKGVRAHYLIFKKKNDAQCPMIEIQIMTMLSWAWDKKDHYLIYEPERKGIKVSDRGKIKMNAMSELLYVADEFFDSIQQELS